MENNELQTTTESYITNSEEHQYLTFMLGDEIFGIGALSIKEIITYGTITKVPTMSPFVAGITNVRGNVIPVISLAERFGVSQNAITNKTCIIIVSIPFDSEKIDIGLIVDRVDQVHDILPLSIEETPSFGTKIKREFLEKIGKVDGKFISILNNETILNIDELSQVRTQRYQRREG